MPAWSEAESLRVKLAAACDLKLSDSLGLILLQIAVSLKSHHCANHAGMNCSRRDGKSGDNGPHTMHVGQP